MSKPNGERSEPLGFGITQRFAALAIGLDDNYFGASIIEQRLPSMRGSFSIFARSTSFSRIN